MVLVKGTPAEILKAIDEMEEDAFKREALTTSY